MRDLVHEHASSAQRIRHTPIHKLTLSQCTCTHCSLERRCFSQRACILVVCLSQEKAFFGLGRNCPKDELAEKHTHWNTHVHTQAVNIFSYLSLAHFWLHYHWMKAKDFLRHLVLNWRLCKPRFASSFAAVCITCCISRLLHLISPQIVCLDDQSGLSKYFFFLFFFLDVASTIIHILQSEGQTAFKHNVNG